MPLKSTVDKRGKQENEAAGKKAQQRWSIKVKRRGWWMARRLGGPDDRHQSGERGSAFIRTGVIQPWKEAKPVPGLGRRTRFS